MSWTKKHDEFCVKFKVTRCSVQCLWRWLLRRQAEGREQEIDLEDFNKWIKRKRGTAYDRKTLRTALAALVDANVVKINRSYTWRIHKLVVYPLDFAIKKSDPTWEIQPELKEVEPSKTKEIPASVYEQQQQEVIEQRTLCALNSAGLNFEVDDAIKLSRYGEEAVESAIEMWKFRSLTSTINNNEGWLVNCLKKGHWIKWIETQRFKTSRQGMRDRMVSAFLEAKEWLVDVMGALPYRNRGDAEISFVAV